MQAYSDPSREQDPHSLPDIEIFELTASEAVEMDEDLMFEGMKLFPLANMNSREREKLIDWAVEESGSVGGWYWQACFPGCLPDGPPMGPFASRADALRDARENSEEYDR